MKKLLLAVLVLAGLGFGHHTLAASRFWVGGSGTWDNSDTTHWSGSSGGAGGQSAPTSTDAVTFDANSTGTITVAADFNISALTWGACGCTIDFSANNNSVTIDNWSGSGTGVRAMNLGSSTVSITGSNKTAWTMSTITSLTWNPGSSTIQFTSNATSGTRTLTKGALSYWNWKVTAGTDTVQQGSTSLGANNVDYTGFSGALTGSGSWNAITGNLTLGAGMTFTNNGNWTFTTPTSTTSVLTNNGVQWQTTLTINASGTVQFADNFSSTGGITFTAGVLDTNSKNVTMTNLSASNSNSRTLMMGSTGTPTWTLTSGVTPWQWSSVTGAAISTNTATINITDASGGSPTIAMGTLDQGGANFTLSGSGAEAYTVSGAGTNVGTLTISNTNPSSTVAFTTNGKGITNLVFSGYTGSWTGSATITSLTGNLTFSAGMTSTYTGAITFSRTSGTSLLTTNGVTLANSIVMDGVGGTVQLQDAYTSTLNITVTNGTLDTNSRALTVSVFNANNSNTKTITITNSTVTLIGTGVVINLSASGTTLNSSGSTIVISDASASSKTFSGGAFTYGNLWLTGGGTGTFVIGASTAIKTFSDFRADPGLALQFFAGSTTTATTFSVYGRKGAPITLNSTTGGSSYNLTKAGGGTVCSDWLTVQDSSSTTPANTWYAGANSTNVSGNSGWQFRECPYSTDVTTENAGIQVDSGSFIITQ